MSALYLLLAAGVASGLLAILVPVAALVERWERSR